MTSRNAPATLARPGADTTEVAVMYWQRNQPVSGHVFVVARQRGPQFYVKWRDANGQHPPAADVRVKVTPQPLHLARSRCRDR